MWEMWMKKMKIVCIFCGVGCMFEVWMKDCKILKVELIGEGFVNKFVMCVKGKFGWDFVNSEKWIMMLFICEGNEFVLVSWEDVIYLVVIKL